MKIYCAIIFLITSTGIVIPSSIFAKPKAVLVPLILEGEYSSKTTSSVFQNLKGVLSEKYEVISGNQYITVRNALKDKFDSGICNTDACVRGMQDVLQADHFFSMELRKSAQEIQLIATHVDRDERHVMDEFCKSCDGEKIAKRARFLAEQIISPDPFFPSSTMPVLIPQTFTQAAEVADLLTGIPDINYQDVGSFDVDIGVGTDLSGVSFTNKAGQNSVDSTVEEDILIFSLSPDLVKEADGEFLVQVSAFSPLKSVSINGRNQPLAPKSYQAKFGVDYHLKPGENFFEIKVVTESGETEQEFIVFFETKEIKRDAGKVKPFMLIVILGWADDDNTNNVPSGTTKVHSTKSSFVLVPVFNQKITYFSTFSVKGLITGDRQQKSEFKSREFMLKQLAFEWTTRKTFLGDVTFGVGANRLSTKDTQKTSSYRDSWFSKYKRAGADSFINFGFKFGADKGTEWSVKFDHKLKSVPGTPSSKGLENSFKIGAKNKFGIYKTYFNLGQSTTNLQDDSKDKAKVDGSAKLNMPLKPVLLSLQAQLSESKDRLANSTTGIKTKSRKKTYKFGVTYPLASWLILAYSRKLEQQESNLTNKDYKKNSNSLQLTMIF
ncbi:MAG TPA: hypothetical protein EYM80_07465 [Deltaproteobacteria bacterium]|nr:hypothetical protein [Candidatus Lambdaproteobacteria bacterium]HIN48041.1 hypothetical protein [Deltaproteobacteria bacterium]